MIRRPHSATWIDNDSAFLRLGSRACGTRRGRRQERERSRTEAHLTRWRDAGQDSPRAFFDHARSPPAPDPAVRTRVGGGSAGVPGTAVTAELALLSRTRLATIGPDEAQPACRLGPRTVSTGHCRM